ncbi:hypothetical protein HOD19_00100 [bacterium]|nr:hypothetical protein [bacterium]MBT4649243.1 hypothetical protein [bacterium]
MEKINLANLIKNMEFKKIIGLFVLALVLSGCSVTGHAEEVEPKFTDLKSCVYMCQENFCEVDIEGRAECLQNGFDTCQKNCQLRFR